MQNVNDIEPYGMEKKPPTVKRSVSLSQKTNNDLISLTEALGVNAHSYMVNELAKAIQRDSLALQVKDNTNDQLSNLISTLKDSIEG